MVYPSPDHVRYGADDGTRTRNRRFTKPLLYQLSYVGATGRAIPQMTPSAPGNDRAGRSDGSSVGGVARGAWLARPGRSVAGGAAGSPGSRSVVGASGAGLGVGRVCRRGRSGAVSACSARRRRRRSSAIRRRGGSARRRRRPASAGLGVSGARRCRSRSDGARGSARVAAGGATRPDRAGRRPRTAARNPRRRR